MALTRTVANILGNINKNNKSGDTGGFGSEFGHQSRDTTSANVEPSATPPSKEEFGPPVPSVTNTVSPSSNSSSSSIKQKLDAAAIPNPLNKYYQVAYHFRLFMCSDQDIISQSGGYLSNITGRKFKQVTVAETGVTGFNIRNVKIHSVCSQTDINATQQSTAVTMTVVDPLGTNFLDGIYSAASLVGIHDYTKCSYYLELSFTGYNEDGSYGGRPLSGMSNGGTWVYQLVLTKINTSINEGGGVFDLEFVTDITIPLLDIRSNNQNTLPQTLTVFGTTVKEIFSDYTRKYNKAIEDLYGIGIQKIKEIKTHPIATGPSTSLNKDPGNFKLKFQEPDKSYQRGMNFSSQNGQTSCQIPAGTTTADFIMSTILNTEEGQRLIKGEDISKVDVSNKKPNSKGVRESVIFNVEPVFSKKGVEIGVTNSYVTEITYHVTSHSTMLGITPASVVAAKSPDVQKTMYDIAINQGFFKKRYDYLYTGKNTEVISYDIRFDTKYTAALATRQGARLSMDNVATHALLNDVNKSSNQKIEVKQNDAKPYISTLISAQPISISNNGLGGPVSSDPLINSISKSLYNNNNSLTAIEESTSNMVVPTIVNASQQKISGTVTSNIYVEDFLDRKSALPISFAQDIETSDNTGSGYTGAYDRDKSTVGAILSNIYGSLYTTAFQKIELTIRGDPYWLGQTNIERIMLLESGKSTNAAKADQADFLTAHPMLQMYFKYPIKMGDDFVPVLKDSEVFDGTYQINEVINSFENGNFTQTLKGVLHPIMTIKADNANSGDTTSNNAQSSNGKSSPSSPSNVNGGLPISGSLPTRLNDAVNVTPTSIQKNDSTTIGSLSQQQTAQMKASLGASESNNNQYAPANSEGKIGQYQMGQSALQDAGYTVGQTGNPNYDPKNPGTWGWSGKDGVNSYQDYLKNADAQNTSFNNFAISNRNILVNNGVINNNTTPEQEAGFIMAAHLGGAKGTSDYFNRVQSNSSYIPTDSNGTSIVNYYQLGQQAVSKVK